MSTVTTLPAAPAPAPASRRGTTTIADAVVLKVAAGAVRGVAGVHAVGGAGARAARTSTRGLSVAVAEGSADVAVELVAQHGTSLPAVADAVRRAVAEAVQSLTGLRVGVVDVLVADVHVPADDGGEQLPQTPTTAS